jgi:hypothetical protein
VCAQRFYFPLFLVCYMHRSRKHCGSFEMGAPPPFPSEDLLTNQSAWMLGARVYQRRDPAVAGLLFLSVTAWDLSTPGFSLPFVYSTPVRTCYIRPFDPYPYLPTPSLLHPYGTSFQEEVIFLVSGFLAPHRAFGGRGGGPGPVGIVRFCALGTESLYVPFFFCVPWSISEIRQTSK